MEAFSTTSNSNIADFGPLMFIGVWEVSKQPVTSNHGGKGSKYVQAGRQQFLKNL